MNGLRLAVQEIADLHREMRAIIAKAPAMTQAMIAFKKAAEQAAETREFKEFMECIKEQHGI